jgi:prepilin peptidase CpaA
MILVPAGLALVAAALHDIAARTIPNGLSLAIACAGLLARATANELLPGLVAAGLVFLLGWAAWRCRVMGGGDVKLLAACALLAPPAAVPGLVLAVALAGGVLALAYLALQPLVPVPALARPGALPARALRAEAWRIRRRGPLPYGVAIALGTFFTLLG